MVKKDIEIVLDADVIIHFAKGEMLSILPSIFPDYKYVVLDIHNENSEDKDYPNYIIVDEDNQKYVTGSKTFFNSFLDIYEELKDCNEEWFLKIYKVDSKNYKGKQFITCSVA